MLLLWAAKLSRVSKCHKANHWLICVVHNQKKLDLPKIFDADKIRTCDCNADQLAVRKTRTLDIRKFKTDPLTTRALRLDWMSEIRSAAIILHRKQPLDV